MHDDFALSGLREKSVFNSCARISSNRRFYNAFGVCSIICMFWACSMRSKICPQWCLGKADFCGVAGNAPNCKFKRFLISVGYS